MVHTGLAVLEAVTGGLSVQRNQCIVQHIRTPKVDSVILVDRFLLGTCNGINMLALAKKKLKVCHYSYLRKMVLSMM